MTVMPDLSVSSVFTEYTEVEMNLQAFNPATVCQPTTAKRQI
jgi:hypothetical protein